MNHRLIILFRHIQRGWQIVLGCTVLGALAGTVFALLPRHYTAISRVQVRPGSSSQYRLDSSELLNASGNTNKLETETIILDSDTLLLDTAHKLHLDTNPEFAGKVSSRSLSPVLAEEKLLTALHRNIQIVLLPRSEIIQVSCSSRSGALSARVVNTLVAEYIQHLFVSRFSSTQRVGKWLSGQLDDLKKQVESDEEKLTQLQGSLGVIGLDQNHDIIVTELEDLTRAADDARANRIIAEAQYRVLRSNDIDLIGSERDLFGHNPPPSSQESLLTELRNRKAMTEARYAELSTQFGAKYPELQQVAANLSTLNYEIVQEQNRILNQAQRAYDAANNNEQMIFNALKIKKEMALQKQSDMVKYRILLHDYESDRNLYEGLLQRLRQAGIVAGLESSEVDIVDLARVPGRPSEMNRISALMLGLLLGLLSGVVISIFVDNYDIRVQQISFIENQLELPVLTLIGRVNKKLTKQKSLQFHCDMKRFCENQSSNTLVESMWMLRASLLPLNIQSHSKIILISSCNPGEGKSTVCAALAYVLANNSRVLLVDGNMRCPAVHEHFEIDNKYGLSSVLSGKCNIDSAIQPIGTVPNLFVLPSGPTPPSAAQLLFTDQLEKMFEEIKSKYEFVIIDSPMMLGISDTAALAKFAEVIIAVVDYEIFRPLQIQRATEFLRRFGFSINGIALNFASAAAFRAYGSDERYRSTKTQ